MDKPRKLNSFDDAIEVKDGSPEETSIPIKSAILIDAARLPGLGTDVNLNRSKFPDLKMRWVDGRSLHGIAKGIEFIIPGANINSMIVAK